MTSDEKDRAIVALVSKLDAIIRDRNATRAATASALASGSVEALRLAVTKTENQKEEAHA